MDNSPSPQYSLCLCIPGPPFVMFPLLEFPMFPSLYVQILPPTESLQGPRLPLTEDAWPSPFSRPFLTNSTSWTAFIPFSFKVVVSGSEHPHPFGESLCKSYTAKSFSNIPFTLPKKTLKRLLIPILCWMFTRDVPSRSQYFAQIGSFNPPIYSVW